MMLLELILLLIGGQFTVTTGELFETQFYCLHSGTAINTGYALQQPAWQGESNFFLLKLF